MHYSTKKTLMIVMLFMFLGMHALSAQSTRRDTIQPPKKQVEVIRFGDDDGGRSGKGKHKKKSNGIIKTAPLSFILGYVPVLYEYKINDWLSLQGGTGITFKPSVSGLYAIIDEECADGNCGNNLDYSYRKSKLGTMLAFAPRLYFGSDAPEESYIAPEIRMYFRRTNAQAIDPASQYEIIRLNDQYDKESIRFTDFMVNYGNQTLYPSLTIDWSIGVGLRKISGKIQQTYYNETTGFYFSQLDKASNPYAFRLDIGLRIGFQL
jgi:hypothetical protein